MFLPDSTVKAMYITFSVVSAEAVIRVYVSVCLSLTKGTAEIQVRTIGSIILLRSPQVLLLLVLMTVVCL